MKQLLYLASSSVSRKNLLKESQIPFSLISQRADESQCSLQQSLESLVRQLAILKMDHIIYPSGKVGQIAFFLTADTMVIDSKNNFYGKPVSREEAVAMIKACRDGVTVGTGFCLERKIFAAESGWRTQERIVGYDQAWCVADVPDAFLDFYLDRVQFLDICGGLTVESFGDQFLKEVRGSYSAILGLPMYKVREALYSLGFYSSLGRF